MTGSAGQKRVPRGYFACKPFPLPPLAEQKRIVAKVDELMALCDRLEAQQQERDTRHAALTRASLARFADAPTPANLQFLFHKSYDIDPADLRKSILTLAVQGKLIRQDFKASDNYLAGCEAAFPIPMSWRWHPLDELISIKHGYAFKSEHFTSEPTPHVVATPGNFFEAGGFRDRGNRTKYYTAEPPEDFILTPRDLIIPMTEQAAGLLGSPAFIPNDGKTYLHNQRLGLIQTKGDALTLSYLACFFKSPYFRKEIGDTATGMKVRHTSPKKILKIPIPLPPLAEQRRIVAKVDQLMTLVDELETQLTASRATAKNLLEALVAELTAAGESSPEVSA